jgi:hypothetical protein
LIFCWMNTRDAHTPMPPSTTIAKPKAQVVLSQREIAACRSTVCHARTTPDCAGMHSAGHAWTSSAAR